MKKYQKTATNGGTMTSPICKFVGPLLYQNPPICLGCSASSHRHAHINTHIGYIHIHTLGFIATYSVKMTEYNKASEARLGSELFHLAH